MLEQKWCHLRLDHPVRALQGHKRPDPIGPVEAIATLFAIFVVGMATTAREVISFIVKRCWADDPDSVH